MRNMDKLMRIQTRIKAPKNLYNSFGKYNYRNAESICEAVKPFLAEERCALVLADEMVEVCGRVYVKATASLYDNEADAWLVNVSAYAREADSKKGMDESQVTGTASSYARKYALNGLFLLDDTKDADTDEYKMQTDSKDEAGMQKQAQKIGKMKISDVKVKSLESRCAEAGIKVEAVASLYKVNGLSDLTENQFTNMHANWEKVVERCK